MSYTLTTSDGSVVINIPDGQFDNSTSLTLPGPNSVGYGQYLNQNLLTLLESFASNSAPSGTNIQGQLWFNKGTQTLNVFTTQGYLPVSGIVVSTTQPVNANSGSTWFDTTTSQYHFYDGTSWSLIGPIYTKAQGVSGAIPVVVNDGTISGVTHNIVQLQYGNFVLATLSSDNTFTPSPAIPGFPTINPGITLNNTISNPSITTDVVGNLTGNVTGSLSGASVVATNLYGRLTGNVIGNVTATTVSANNITGSLFGNTGSLYSVATNFSTANAAIGGGYATGLVNVQATNASYTNEVTTNFSSANVLVTGGSANGLTTLQATTVQATNFSSPNVTITSGNITGLSNLQTTNIAVTNSTVNNLTSSNITATSGNITGLTLLATTNSTVSNLIAVTASATTLVATNFSSANVLITGGYISSVANVTTTTLTATKATLATTFIGNLSTANAQITGGSISNLTTLGAGATTLTTLTTGAITGTTATFSGTISAVNPTFTGTPTAPTAPAGTNTTQIATTAFALANGIPSGAILLWSGSIATIPSGWLLCNGSNGTPDLRDRFLVGAGNSYAVGAIGGSANTVVVSHTHIATSAVTDTGHAHTFQGTGLGSQGAKAGNETNHWETKSTDAAFTGISVNTTVTATGVSGINANLPPYYALAYIMKA